VSGIVGNREQTIANLFRLYRFKWIRITFCHATTATEYPVIAFSSGGNITAPTTLEEVFDLDEVVFTVPGQTTPVHMVLQGENLAGMMKWYQTEGTGDVADDTQGNFVIATYAAGACTADTFAWVAEYEIEFSDRLPAAASLARLKLPPVDLPGVEAKYTANATPLPGGSVSNGTPPNGVRGAQPGKTTAVSSAPRRGAPALTSPRPT
jgi:hypothetical protein